MSAAVVMVPLLPRAPDLYAHLLWGWQVMRCLDHGQLPFWLPDLNAGFGSPGIRLYSPLGPMVTGSLGWVLGDIGRGLRAAAAVAAAAVLVVSRLRCPAGVHRAWTGVVLLASPMVVFSLVGRTAWSEFLAIPLAWWVLERVAIGRFGVLPLAVIWTALWLVHAPTAFMVGSLAGIAVLLHRSKRVALALLTTVVMAAGLTAWHWLPLWSESSQLDRAPDLTTGIFDPARNVLGSATAHDLEASIWLGWVAVSLLAAILVTGLWRRQPGRAVVVVLCVALASPLARPLWQLESPLQWLQFPWRWLLPATLVMVPAALERGRSRALVLLCLLAPTVAMPRSDWVRLPPIDEHLGWVETGEIISGHLGGNPLLVDVPENRPPAYSGLGRDLVPFGPDRSAVVLEGQALVRVRRERPLQMCLEVEASGPTTVAVRILDYPFWSVFVDGREVVDRRAATGPVRARIPAGRHDLEVRWTGNPRAAAGQIVAAVTLMLMVIGRRRWSRL